VLNLRIIRHLGFSQTFGQLFAHF